MSRKVLVVIDPAGHTPELACYNLIAKRSPIATSYHLPALFGFNSLAAIGEDEIGGIIIFGSSTSVHDKLPWQHQLNTWLTRYLDRYENTPVLAICYAHQMLAAVYGGKVTFLDPTRRKLEGLRRIEFSDNRWTKASSGLVCVSHREIVSEVPNGFRVIARSDEVAIEAFQHNHKPIWGIQAHPEATQEFLDNQGIALQNEPANPFDFGHKLVSDFLGKLAL